MPLLTRRTAGASFAAAVLATSVLLALAPTAGATDVIGGPRLATSGVVVGAGATPLPQVAAASWMVVDLTTGKVLAAKAPHLRLRPASTLKTLTSVTLMPHLDPGANHFVSAAEQAPVYGSRVGLVVGSTYTIDQLWYGLLLPSGNDAAAALAAAYGGIPKTLAAMRAEARHLQAYDTTVKNPSGLDADGQFISAYDMALFAQAALKLPEFVKVSHTISYNFPGASPAPGKARTTYKIYGENRLLNHGYPGVIAGKTGYTTLAHRTFWVAANRGGHTVLVTLMDIQESTESAARKLMTWGLANAGRAGAVGTLVQPLAGPAPSTSPVSAASPGTSDHTVAAPAAAGSTSSSGSSWLLPALVVLALLVGGLLLWRRGQGRAGRGPSHAAGSTPAPEPAPGPVGDPPVVVRAPDPPPAAPSRPATVIASASAPVRAPAPVPTQAPEVLPPPAGSGIERQTVPGTGNVTVVRPVRRPEDGAPPA
jgi:D-alanyl-D-alanine carboxypeptidase (penicillin-binding protein 5/6)